jgi:DNA-binding response OmpR family regulator
MDSKGRYGMKTILLIEDDTTLAASLTHYLKQEGYRVEATGTAREGKAGLDRSPDLIILDWMLPDQQGIDFLKELRAANNRIPVILLTARTELVDKVLGLESGANDYLTKPFEPRELMARIRAQLRATQAAGASELHIRCGEIELHDDTKKVFFRGNEIPMTKMEYLLLKLFAENPDKVFTRDELLNKVWGYDSYPTTRTVDNHVFQLRQKLDESLFETVRGIGYRLKMTKK